MPHSVTVCPFQTDKPLCAFPRLRCPFTPHHPPNPPKWALDGGMGEFWTCLNFSQVWAAVGACQLASTTLAAASTAENKVSSAKWLYRVVLIGFVAQSQSAELVASRHE